MLPSASTPRHATCTFTTPPRMGPTGVSTSTDPSPLDQTVALRSPNTTRTSFAIRSFSPPASAHAEKSPLRRTRRGAIRLSASSSVGAAASARMPSTRAPPTLPFSQSGSTLVTSGPSPSKYGTGGQPARASGAAITPARESLKSRSDRMVTPPPRQQKHPKPDGRSAPARCARAPG